MVPKRKVVTTTILFLMSPSVLATSGPGPTIDCDKNCSQGSLHYDGQVRELYGAELNALDIFYTFFLACVIVASVLGNGLIALVLFRKRSLSPSSRLVFSLCSSNFAVSLLVFPFSLASSVLQAWIFGQYWCFISAFLIHMIVTASNMTLAAIAIDRYIAIVKPMAYGVTITTAKSVLILLAIWTLSIVVNLPPLFQWPQIAYEPMLSVCLANLESNTIYSSFLFFWNIVLPSLIMTSSYGCIFKVARSKYKKINIGTVSGAVRHHQSADPSIHSMLSHPSHHNEQLETSKAHSTSNYNLNRQYVRKPSWLSIVLQSPVKGFAVICCILGIFYLCWTPYVISMFAVGGQAMPKNSWQMQCAYYLLMLSIPSYPIVYGLLNRSIRKDLSMWLKAKSQSAPHKLQFRVSSSISQSNAPIVGFLDYTPPFSQWQFTGQVKDPGVVKSQIKSSDDSGRFSLANTNGSQSDTESQTSSETALVIDRDDENEVITDQREADYVLVPVELSTVQ